MNPTHQLDIRPVAAPALRIGVDRAEDQRLATSSAVDDVIAMFVRARLVRRQLITPRRP